MLQSVSVYIALFFLSFRWKIFFSFTFNLRNIFSKNRWFIWNVNSTTCVNTDNFRQNRLWIKHQFQIWKTFSSKKRQVCVVNDFTNTQHLKKIFFRIAFLFRKTKEKLKKDWKALYFAFTYLPKRFTKEF